MLLDLHKRLKLIFSRCSCSRLFDGAVWRFENATSHNSAQILSFSCCKFIVFVVVVCVITNERMNEWMVLGSQCTDCCRCKTDCLSSWSIRLTLESRSRYASQGNELIRFGVFIFLFCFDFRLAGKEANAIAAGAPLPVRRFFEIRNLEFWVWVSMYRRMARCDALIRLRGSSIVLASGICNCFFQILFILNVET